MIVRVRLFAAARQAAGRDVLELQMPPTARIGQLRRQLAERFAEVSQLFERAMFAVDAEYVGDDAPIPPHAEVACIPPVSGG